MDHVLLHICCGNCALGPVGEFRESGVRFTGFWFNPNIHPADEHARRLATLHSLRDRWGFELIERGEPDRPAFDSAVSDYLASGGRVRCGACYRMRLDATAAEAAALGIPYITTTLLISPYQDHALIAEEGHAAAERHGVRFRQADWRPAFRVSQALARDLGHYRQDYCGCHHSMAERDERRAARRAQTEAALG